MKPLDSYELTDLKRIYRTLHGQLQNDFDLTKAAYEESKHRNMQLLEELQENNRELLLMRETLENSLREFAQQIYPAEK